jgi:prepilin-type N-terminal cleavage/methylation domain-containing protein
MEDFLRLWMDDGFSLIELLFALMLLSFGLTALMQTQNISASTLNNSQERFAALLIARQFLDHALVANGASSLNDTICQNNVCYFVSQKNCVIADTQTQITIEVRWRKSLMTLSSRATHY